MAEFPALPFFTDAYLADTRHLTTEEHGAYLLLLMCAWRTRGCVLKANDRQLARIAGVSPTKWRRLKPVLAEFFTVDNGSWRQKKLTYVHESVSKKVARNRQNGARGGRATAAKHQTPAGSHTSEQKPRAAAGNAACPEMPQTAAGFEAGWHLNSAASPVDQRPSTHVPQVKDKFARQHCEKDSDGCSELAPNASPAGAAGITARAQATKTKTKAKTKPGSSSGEMSPYGQAAPVPLAGSAPTLRDKSATNSASTIGYGNAMHAKIAAAAGLNLQFSDEPTMVLWHAAEASVDGDILPTLEQISAREIVRTGARPVRLAYYSGAVLEARDKRLGATKKGAAHATANPAKPPAVEFQKTDPEHWRKFLGNPKSKFRGDYVSKNWRIPTDHPNFKSAFLGADPRHAVNAAIPSEIYALYGPGWGWLFPTAK